MIYIKVAIVTGILSILTGIDMPFEKPEFMLCLCIAYAFSDKDKIRCIIVSAIAALISAALTDRFLLFCVLWYMLPTLAVSEFFVRTSKLDVIYNMLIVFAVTFIGEFIFYHLFVGVPIIGYTSWILSESILTAVMGVVVYLIVYRLINPKKRKYKITVE